MDEYDSGESGSGSGSEGELLRWGERGWAGGRRSTAPGACPTGRDAHIPVAHFDSRIPSTLLAR